MSFSYKHAMLLPAVLVFVGVAFLMTVQHTQAAHDGFEDNDPRHSGGAPASADPLDAFGGSGPTVQPTAVAPTPAPIGSGSGAPTPTGNVGNIGGNNTQNTGPGLNYTIKNPLNANITSVGDFLTAILNVLLVIAVPVIVFFIIFAGFTYVTAQGNPEKIKTATRSLTYAIIGGVLILGSVALSTIITNIVNSFGPTVGG